MYVVTKDTYNLLQQGVPNVVVARYPSVNPS